MGDKITAAWDNESYRGKRGPERALLMSTTNMDQRKVCPAMRETKNPIIVPKCNKDEDIISHVVHMKDRCKDKRSPKNVDQLQESIQESYTKEAQ